MSAMPDTLPVTPRRSSASARRLLAGVAVAFLLALIFAAYLRPGFALDLLNRFILCL